MLKKIRLKNFKCFEDLSLEMTNLNVLTGINSMGKSTVIQALLLLKQTKDLNDLGVGLHLNGDLVTIGTGYDLLNRNSDDETIGIEIVDDMVSFKLDYSYNKDSDFQSICNFKRENPETTTFSEQDVNIFNSNFAYISAERLGPQRFYTQSYHKVMENNDIGSSGEFTADYLSERGFNDKVSNKLILSESSNSDLLIYQMEAWLSEISPGLKLNCEKYNDAGIVNVKYGVSGEQYTPINVGYGLSYVAPIILSLLKAHEGDLVILENPEAHLHPKGQRRMGELIARAASDGVQVIVETHSDHLLNGIRLSVKNKVINKNDVRLNYFIQERTEYGKTCHRKISPAILDDGRLSDWPEGFFDEWDKALDELL